MKNYNIVFLGKNRELFSFIKECLKEFELNFREVAEWINLKKNITDNPPSLIILSSDTKHLFKDPDFNKFRKTETGKLPVFIFSKDIVSYKTTMFFKEKLAEALKKTWAESVLPRKQTDFGSVKIGKIKDDKRKHLRISVKTPVAISEAGTKTEGTLRNLSAGGISVKTEKRIPDSESYRITFSLEEGKQFNLRGVKIRDADMGEHWHTAFRFAGITSAESDDIEEYTGNLLVLKNLSVFSEFNAEELIYVQRTGKKFKAPAGSVIFSEGAAGNNFYVVFEGKIKIFKTIGQEGAKKEKFLAFIHPGEFFGEMALLINIPRSGSAQAAADSVLFKIDRDSLDNLFNSRQDIAVKFYRAFISALIERLRMADQELIDSPFTRIVRKTQF
ncbi:MAG: cyclic nucleotide-binding domain-containing protein [bacterium]